MVLPYAFQPVTILNFGPNSFARVPSYPACSELLQLHWFSISLSTAEHSMAPPESCGRCRDDGSAGMCPPWAMWCCLRQNFANQRPRSYHAICIDQFVQLGLACTLDCTLPYLHLADLRTSGRRWDPSRAPMDSCTARTLAESWYDSGHRRGQKPFRSDCCLSYCVGHFSTELIAKDLAWLGSIPMCCKLCSHASSSSRRSPGSSQRRTRPSDWRDLATSDASTYAKILFKTNV